MADNKNLSEEVVSFGTSSKQLQEIDAVVKECGIPSRSDLLRRFISRGLTDYRTTGELPRADV